MALEAYRSKRNFAATAEPRGRTPHEISDIFVVQKHDATRLHYDFRLALDGVLKSWAVTRGPSLIPGEKRLAVAVEDHPLEYADFEGTIAEGEYGGGSVIVWDRGAWTPIGDAHKGLKKGQLDFELHGQKLGGRWHLVRMRAKPREKRENWLLIKGDDEFARPAGATDILDERPESVKTGRSIDELAGESPGWSSKGARTRERAAPDPSASFQGLREDKPAREITRETTMDVASERPQSSVKLTHPDRVYWPDVGVTKEGLADYYGAVWRFISPFIVGRPLALVRCPDGVGGQTFFQKHAWQGSNPNIVLVNDPADPSGEALISIRDFDGLMALAQSAALEIHPWGSTIANWERPDTLVMDLDPGEDVAWASVIAAAEEVRGRLKSAGLVAFVKTSGGKGLHVVAPVKPNAEWPAAKAFAKSTADAMAADNPELYVSTIPKARRHGKILIDYLRNQRGMTAVAAYSTRARPGAPVSMPLAWNELNPGIGPAHFTIPNTPTRLASLAADPWGDFRAAAAPVEAPKLGKSSKRR
jgi:bifunctional non-homologous end joining protein LigD